MWTLAGLIVGGLMVWLAAIVGRWLARNVKDDGPGTWYDKEIAATKYTLCIMAGYIPLILFLWYLSAE